MPSLSQVVYSNKFVPPKDPVDLSFASQTVLVTGSNTGIGFESAKKIARNGAARVILAVRSVDKGAAAQEHVQSAASDKDCLVEVWSLDMLSYTSVKALVEKAKQEVPKGFHAVVLNAGVFKTKYVKSSQGWEETLQVNLLSTVLLALLLLPVCARAKTETLTPTLELVSASMHYMHKLSPKVASGKVDSVLGWYNDEANFSTTRVYGGSKLMLMYALPGIVQAAGKDVYVTTVCPGAARSDIARDYTSLSIRAAKSMMNVMFFRTTEEGSRSVVSGLGLGERGVGRFWQSDTIKEPAKLLQGDVGGRLQPRVWEEILAALEEATPEIRSACKS